MNKFLFKKLYVVYFLISKLRMSYYISIGKKEKAKEIITEHFNW